MKHFGQKKRKIRYNSPNQTDNSYSFPSEPSPRDKHGLSVLLQVPEVANLSMSNLINHEHIIKCFEGLSILARASTKRFRYLPASNCV